MQLPNEWINGILGALAAIAAMKFSGRLREIILGENTNSPSSRPPVFYPAGAMLPPSSPTYETTVNIPHKITVTPQ